MIFRDYEKHEDAEAGVFMAVWLEVSIYFDIVVITALNKEALCPNCV